MNEVKEILASILGCDADTLPAESTPLRDIKGWDSLKHVLLVVGLEKRLNTKLTAEEIRGLVTMADLAGMIRQKNGDG